MRPSFLSAALSLSLLSFSSAQLITALDGDGNTVLATIATNARGVATDTLILSTIGLAATVAETTVEETTAVAATTAAVAATTGGPLAATNQPLAVNGGTPSTRCTTAGCPVAPTTYTAANGAIATWFASTPTTPIPTWTSSGSIIGAAAYISTTLTAPGLMSSASSTGNWGWMNQYGVMAGAIVVGGLAGALAVL